MVKVRKATFPAFGIDTVMPIASSDCWYLIRNGFSFAVRYLGMLTQEELHRITCSGLAVMPVTTSRGRGWVPSEALGLLDGAKAVRHLQGLGIPSGATVWLDLEGCNGPAEETSDWVNAWSRRVKDAGFEAGLYVGANPGGLSSEDLWNLPYTTRYWRSCSRVPEPANRGWCMQQLKPWNFKLGPMIVDVDIIENDYKMCRPAWVVAD